MSAPIYTGSILDVMPNHASSAAAACAETSLWTESSGLAAWYAVYTRSRHEKYVATQCSQRSVECFLPTYTARRTWGHRHAVVELPLFPTYLFVHIPLQDKLRVQTIPGVVSFVTVSGRPASLTNSEIEALQNAVRCRGIEPHPYLKVGKRVRVRSGPLAGLEGIITRRKDKVRVIVSIDWMSRAVAVQLEGDDLEGLC